MSSKDPTGSIYSGYVTTPLPAYSPTPRASIEETGPAGETEIDRLVTEKLCDVYMTRRRTTLRYTWWALLIGTVLVESSLVLAGTDLADLLLILSLSGMALFTERIMLKKTSMEFGMLPRRSIDHSSVRKQLDRVDGITYLSQTTALLTFVTKSLAFALFRAQLEDYICISLLTVAEVLMFDNAVKACRRYWKVEK